VCQSCSHGSGTDEMLVCDGCGSTYHSGCLIHPLAELPRSEWQCPKCIARVNILVVLYVQMCFLVISTLLCHMHFTALTTYTLSTKK